MPLSFTCPGCGKRFERIKTELAGKKAKCACGNIVRLGEKPSVRKPKDREAADPDDLMSVDLMGDELLGDQLLGGDFDTSLPDKVQPQVAESRPSPRSTKIGSQAQSTKNEAEIPVVAVSKKRAKSRKKRSSAHRIADLDKPIVGDTFGDLDSILEGVGDAAPIMARPKPAANVSGSDRSAQTGARENETPKRRRSVVGFVAALASATLAFWFGVFAVVSRFEVVNQVFLGGFSATLNSVYHVVFGDTEVPANLQATFSGLGWALWVVAGLLMIFGAAQFLNAFFKLVVGRHFFGWCDGLTASFGVTALFVVVGLLFTQASFQRHQHKFFDDYEKSAVGEGGHLENVVVIRDKFNQEQTTVRNWLIFTAVVSAVIFLLSMIRLFTSASEPQFAESG